VGLSPPPTTPRLTPDRVELLAPDLGQPLLLRGRHAPDHLRQLGGHVLKPDGCRVCGGSVLALQNLGGALGQGVGDEGG
jgi:hypothetical protein